MKPTKPSDFRKLLERVARHRDTRTVFDGFVRLTACALACQTREEEYLEEAKRWEKPDLESFSLALGALVQEMESRPYEDLLGAYYMEFALSTKGQQWNGEFHTPKPICDLMAQMTLGTQPLPVEGPITVAEPACGAGAMILALAGAVPAADRHRLRVTATDVNRTACDMTFINTTLWGVPCQVVHGNTLSLEVWHCWKNIHWICPTLRFLQSAPQHPDIAPVTFNPQPAGQLELIPA